MTIVATARNSDCQFWSERSHGDDLGFTYGTWRRKDEGGEVAAKGKDMSVRRRDAEGRWVVVADLGHSDP